MIQFFVDLEFQAILDLSDDFANNCLWYSFSVVLQKDLDTELQSTGIHTE